MARGIPDQNSHSAFALEKLFGDGDITITRGTPQVPSAAPLTVIFDSRTRHFEKPEFYGTVASMGRHALFIADHKRAWFANPSVLALIVRVVQDEMRRLGCTVIDTLGFSMGGFAAIAYAEKLPVRNALAFSPRYAIDKAMVNDARVRPGLNALGGDAAFRSLDPGLAKLTSAVIVHGTPRDDIVHVRLLRVPQHVDHFVLFGARHNVPALLKNLGLLGAVSQAALSQDRAQVVHLLGSLGAQRRSSPSLGLKLLTLQYRIGLRRFLNRLNGAADGKSGLVGPKTPLH